MYDDRYEIAGPFATTKELCDWGDMWQNVNGDHPTWQSLYLDDPHKLPIVINPTIYTRS